MHSLRSYALRRKALGLPGGSLRAVQRAISSGRIKGAVVTVDGQPKIGDMVEADRLWERHTDPGRYPVVSPAPRAAPAAPATSLTVPAWLAPQVPSNPSLADCFDAGFAAAGESIVGLLEDLQGQALALVNPDGCTGAEASRAQITQLFAGAVGDWTVEPAEPTT